MLVIVSDLHLNDGTVGTRLDPGAMELLGDRLCDLAFRASYRADGTYQPIDRIDLVLLGDVLDLMHSRRWLTGTARPWSDMNSPAVVETVGGIVDDLLKCNVDAIRQLRSLATEGLVTVPHSGSAGSSMRDEIPVAVRTHLMVGDCDWPLHLSGSQYDLMRHKVAHHLGLANQHNKPFPHESCESDELHDALRRHRVLARHGDVFDPLSFADGRDNCSLGDAISIELVCRFLMQIEQELAGEISPAAMQSLREIDQIQPVLLAPAWMESQLERMVPKLATRMAIKRMWDNQVDELLQLDIVHQRNRWSPIDLIEGLAAALKFSRRDSHDWTGRTLNWLASLRGADDASYACHALAETDFRNRRARHIVYGHTHQHECKPLDASHADGFVLNQTYFNAGSWRRTYSPTKIIAGHQEFIGADTCNLLAFYQADERSGRPYEIWSGSLAPSLQAPAQNSGARTDSHAPIAAPIRMPHAMRASAAMSSSLGY
jgi:UDP-2,3-diacylglucosamine pyrophosphatase LpxH